LSLKSSAIAFLLIFILSVDSLNGATVELCMKDHNARSKDFQRYEKCLKSILLSEPKNIEVILKLASIYLKNDRVSKGFELISDAYSIDPLYIQKSSLSKVLDLALRLTKLKQLAQKNRDVELFNELGNDYYKMGIFKDSAKAFKNSLKINPKQNDIKLLLALSLGNLNKMKLASKLIKEVIDTQPYNFYANYYYGKILKNELGKVEDGNSYLLAAKYIFDNKNPKFKNMAERDFIKKDLDIELKER